MQSRVTFSCDDGFPMPGRLTTPDGRMQQPRPGLLLIYEAFGMSDEMDRVAADLAGEGDWTVLIPDLFARGRKPLCVARCILTVTTGRGEPLHDLDAARRYLVGLPEVDSERIGVVGFCMGGGFALLLAMTGRYRASAPFYGLAPRNMPRSCPVVASYGARDLVLKSSPARLEHNLTQLGMPHDVKVYPQAGHSFYTQAPNRAARLIGPFTPLRVQYHEPSARDARKRVVAFFREHLDD